METASMLAIRSPQALVEGPQVRRRLARPERMPVGRFSIFDDRTGGRRVILIESDASSHVEKVPDRRSLVGCFTHFYGHRSCPVGGIPGDTPQRLSPREAGFSSDPEYADLGMIFCKSAAAALHLAGLRSPTYRGSSDLYGSFSVKWFFGLCRFLVWSGKAVPRPVACDQVRGARGKVSRDRNASAA